MPNKQLVIAIDGPAASGKSTTARMVAQRLGYIYIDTGAMYRAATLAVIRSGIDPHDRPAVEQLAAGLSIQLERQLDASLKIYLNNEDVSREIRLPEVTALVSLVSSYPGVRNPIVDQQKKMGQQGGVVLDGRDIGTVVFPDADVKVFMVADILARAERRREELQKMGTDISVEGLASDLTERDRLDSTRETSPLVRADDAVEIDTSSLSIDQQVERVLEIAGEKVKSQKSKVKREDGEDGE